MLHLWHPVGIYAVNMAGTSLCPVWSIQLGTGLLACQCKSLSVLAWECQLAGSSLLVATLTSMLLDAGH